MSCEVVLLIHPWGDLFPLMFTRSYYIIIIIMKILGDLFPLMFCEISLVNKFCEISLVS